MESVVVYACRQALLAVLLLSAPAALAAVTVGLLVSVFQTATQIQEQTLSYVPKLVAVSLALVIAGPWMLTELVRFATGMFVKVSATW